MPTHSTASATVAALRPDRIVRRNFASRIWIMVFPLASAGLFAAQPSAMTTLAISVLLSLTMAAIAHAAVRDESGFEAKLSYVRMLAPVHAALLMWLAVYIGRDLAGTSLVATSLAAFVALGIVLITDALFSGVALVASERGRGAMGTSIAGLVSEKYAGLFGKIE